MYNIRLPVATREAIAHRADGQIWICMMTSSNGNIFRVTGPLRGESTGDQWIPLTEASGAELWCFLWSAPEQTVEQTIETSMIWDAIALIMMSLYWTISNIRRIHGYHLVCICRKLCKCLRCTDSNSWNIREKLQGLQVCPTKWYQCCHKLYYKKKFDTCIIDV